MLIALSQFSLARTAAPRVPDFQSSRSLMLILIIFPVWASCAAARGDGCGWGPTYASRSEFVKFAVVFFLAEFLSKR